jgi:hypothetical protein
MQLVKICSEPMRVRGYASRTLPNLVSTAVAVLKIAIFLDHPRHCTVVLGARWLRPLSI